MKIMNLFVCPKCGGPTNTYRHPWAKVWCPKCEYVLREEGDKRVEHKEPIVKEDPLDKS